MPGRYFHEVQFLKSCDNAVAVAADKANASPSAAENDDKDNQHTREHEALVETAASISPDPLAENFETTKVTAWPERDLTAATAADTNTNTTLSQPTPALSQYHHPLPSETLPYSTLDPQLSTPQPPVPQHPPQWPPRKT